MRHSPVPFTEQHLDDAARLFVESYERERAQSPLLPRRVIDEPAWIREKLQSQLGAPGVAILEDGRLLGFLLTGDRFRWKGHDAAIVLEHGHAAAAGGTGDLYPVMYQALAQQWADQGIHLHLIRHFAHDAALQETLYQLGFGAILAERLRDCSALGVEPGVDVRLEADVGRLAALHAVHNAFYPQSPIFLSKPADPASVSGALAAHAEAGDAVFVYAEQGEPRAYLIVGESGDGGEGFLLQATNTAEVKSAFAQPQLRGKGVGSALLQQAITWAREQGYDRLFVEHETANLYGRAFWSRHFRPYLYSSMRYIDSTLRSGG